MLHMAPADRRGIGRSDLVPGHVSGASLLRLDWVDELRRRRGALLDAAGFGPVETPWREACRANGMRLRIYEPTGSGPMILIVPAPIKRAYIWDLAPGRSVVRRLLAEGIGVGMVEWTEPAGTRGYGLDDVYRPACPGL